MLEFCQHVLDKISMADPRVFRKELRKAFRHLLPDQRTELMSWFRGRCVCKVRTADAQGLRTFKR